MESFGINVSDWLASLALNSARSGVSGASLRRGERLHPRIPRYKPSDDSTTKTHCQNYAAHFRRRLCHVTYM
jgi:hypothetical protein